MFHGKIGMNFWTKVMTNGDGRTIKGRCKMREGNQLLNFCKRLAKLYKAKTGKSLSSLLQSGQLGQIEQSGQSERTRQLGNIFSESVKEICNISPELYGDINVNRHWDEMSCADIEAFSKCLKYSIRDEFLLIRYEETEIWGNSAFRDIKDIWSIYNGLLQECRSTVINLDTIEYVLLPFAKFRNLNESPEYSIEAFSEKLDGSFMQMRFLGDSRFQDGIIVSSSGTLNSEKSRQLADVLKFLRAERAEGAKETEETEETEKAEGVEGVEKAESIEIAEKAAAIKRMVKANPEITFIFEWIGDNDPHVVSYPQEMKGLHLVGMRNIKNGCQFSYRQVIDTAKQYGVPTVSLYSMNFSEILSKVRELKGTEHEGYVLNVDGFLVKIKCPDFLNLMRSVDLSQSFNFIVKYTFEGKIDDFISMLPTGFQDDARAKLRKLMGYVNDVKEQVEAEYSRLPLNAERKDVMLAINKIKNKTIQDFVRAKYLGKPLEIIAKKKSENFQYIKESDIDAYYQN